MPPTDAVTLLETRLTAVEKGVDALIAAMSLVIDTLQQQTHLLAELAEAARETPEGSPVVDAINTLTSAVVMMGEGIEALRTEMGELPGHLKTALTEDGASASQDRGRPPEP